MDLCDPIAERECKYIPEKGGFANISCAECYVLLIFVLHRSFRTKIHKKKQAFLIFLRLNLAYLNNLL